MNNRIITIVLATLVCINISAQESIIPFIKEMPQRLQFNPAFEIDSKAYFSLPFLGGARIGAENTGFCWDDLVSRWSDDSLHIDLDKLASNMRKLNLTSATAETPLASFGIRRYDKYLMFDINAKATADLVFPKSITDLRFGNYDYENDRVVQNEISDVFLRGMSYLELAMGVGRDMSDRARFGVRFKFLLGLASIYSGDMKVKLNTINDNNRCKLEIETKGGIYISAPIEVNTDNDGYVEDIKKTGFSISGLDNRGFAFDMGWAAYFEKVVLGFSARDIGFLTWRHNTHLLYANNKYIFKGLNIDDRIKDNAKKEREETYWSEVVDSLKQFTDVRYTGDYAFKTRLSGKLTGTLEVHPNEHVSINWLVSTRTVKSHFYTQASTNFTLHPAEGFSWSTSATLNHGMRMSFGTGLVFTAGPIQYYLIADRIPFNITKTTGFQFSTGFNFVIGRKMYKENMKREAEEYDNLE